MRHDEKTACDASYPDPSYTVANQARVDQMEKARCLGEAKSVGAGSYTPTPPLVQMLNRLKAGDRTFIERADFGAVLEALNTGLKVARRGWNGRGMYIELQNPDINSKMSRPYIFMRTVDADLVPWVASQTDLLAYDWEIVG